MHLQQPPGPFEKRIKRHVTGRAQAFYIVTPPGMEPLCAAELTELGLTPDDKTAGRGGVLFTGRTIDCYRANLHLRVANRILMRLTVFEATNFRQLAKKTTAFPWELYVYPNAVIQVLVSASHCRLMHTEAVADQFKAALAERLAHTAAIHNEPSPAQECPQRIYVRGENDRWTISLDSSGDLLHKRGLKTHGGVAPVRETIAAAVLKLSGYQPGEPLVDPMCGAGTFSLEAAMMTNRIPAGWFRNFSFMGWPCFTSGQWNHLRREAENHFSRAAAPLIFASDRNQDACLALEKTFQDTILLSEAARIQVTDFFELEPSHLQFPAGTEKSGLIVLNPPYGLRLGTRGQIPRLIADIGRKLQNDFNGWRLALIVPEKSLARQIPFPLTAHSLFHGGLTVTLLTGRIR